MSKHGWVKSTVKNTDRPKLQTNTSIIQKKKIDRPNRKFQNVESPKVDGSKCQQSKTQVKASNKKKIDSSVKLKGLWRKWR